MSVSYQVIFNKKPNLKDLSEILRESFQEYLELDDDLLERILKIQYSKQLNYENKFIIGFKIILDEIFDEYNPDIEEILNTFNDQIKNNDVDAVFKFYDDSLFKRLSDCYYQLFKIEMKLREIITFIFVDTYKEDYYNLVKEIDVNPMYPKKRKIRLDGKDKKLKGIVNDSEKREEYLSNFLENEFFYCMFSQYKMVSRPKAFQYNDLVEITENSKDFSDFQNKLLNRGISDKKYTELLQEINGYVENLEEIRNCIAHNRTPSDIEMLNLEKFLEKLNKKTEQFLENIEEEYNPYKTKSLF